MSYAGMYDPDDYPPRKAKSGDEWNLMLICGHIGRGLPLFLHAGTPNAQWVHPAYAFCKTCGGMASVRYHMTDDDMRRHEAKLTEYVPKHKKDD